MVQKYIFSQYMNYCLLLNYHVFATICQVEEGASTRDDLGNKQNNLRILSQEYMTLCFVR